MKTRETPKLNVFGFSRVNLAFGIYKLLFVSLCLNLFTVKVRPD